MSYIERVAKYSQLSLFWFSREHAALAQALMVITMEVLFLLSLFAAILATSNGMLFNVPCLGYFKSSRVNVVHVVLNSVIYI